ncbi:OsmC family protein [Halobacteriaceae archaeon GCM10025711]
MPTRTAHARWNGKLRDGDGSMEFGSGAYEGAYSFRSRFEEGDGTNPEELIGAAHAGCFSMALAGVLEEAGFSPESVDTEAVVHLEQVEGDFAITRVELETEAMVPEIEESEFMEFAEDAKANCPVSKALAGTEISLSATLASA